MAVAGKKQKCTISGFQSGRIKHGNCDWTRWLVRTESSRQAADLVDDGSHELWVRLLIRQELSDDLVHDILGWEEVVQKLWKDSGHHPSFAG